MAVSVDTEKCIACGICAGECPNEAITIEDTAVVDADACIGCGICIDACPEEALAL